MNDVVISPLASTGLSRKGSDQPDQGANGLERKTPQSILVLVGGEFVVVLLVAVVAMVVEVVIPMVPAVGVRLVAEAAVVVIVGEAVVVVVVV